MRLYENFFPTKNVILAPPTVHLDLIAAFLSTIHLQDFILLEKKKLHTVTEESPAPYRKELLDFIYRKVLLNTLDMI